MCRPNNEEEVELIDKLGRASSDWLYDLTL
jgi:hypothetical protein